MKSALSIYSLQISFDQCLHGMLLSIPSLSHICVFIFQLIIFVDSKQIGSCFLANLKIFVSYLLLLEHLYLVEYLISFSESGLFPLGCFYHHANKIQTLYVFGILSHHFYLVILISLNLNSFSDLTYLFFNLPMVYLMVILMLWFCQ